MHDFSKKYNRKEFLTFLRNFLPDDFSLENEEYKDEPKGDLFRKIYKLGKIESFENLVSFPFPELIFMKGCIPNSPFLIFPDFPSTKAS